MGPLSPLAFLFSVRLVRCIFFECFALKGDFEFCSPPAELAMLYASVGIRTLWRLWGPPVIGMRFRGEVLDPRPTGPGPPWCTKMFCILEGCPVLLASKILFVCCCLGGAITLLL